MVPRESVEQEFAPGPGLDNPKTILIRRRLFFAQRISVTCAVICVILTVGIFHDGFSDGNPCIGTNGEETCLKAIDGKCTADIRGKTEDEFRNKEQLFEECPRGLFYVNPHVKNHCAVGVPISAENECRKAAEYLTQDQNFGGSHSLDYAPTGCFLYNGSEKMFHGVYYNTHPTGGFEEDHYKVCRIEVEGNTDLDEATMCVKSACLKFHATDDDCCAMPSHASCPDFHQYFPSLFGCGRGFTDGKYSTCCTPSRGDFKDALQVLEDDKRMSYELMGLIGMSFNMALSLMIYFMWAFFIKNRSTCGLSLAIGSEILHICLGLLKDPKERDLLWRYAGDGYREWFVSTYSLGCIQCLCIVYSIGAGVHVRKSFKRFATHPNCISATNGQVDSVIGVPVAVTSNPKSDY